MGGKKKPTLSQLERQQRLREEKEKGERGKKEVQKAYAPKLGSISLPNIDDESVVQEILSLKAITPYVVASKYNLRIGVAKQLLRVLEQRKLIKQVSGNAHLRVYAPAAA